MVNITSWGVRLRHGRARMSFATRCCTTYSTSERLNEFEKLERSGHSNLIPGNIDSIACFNGSIPVKTRSTRFTSPFLTLQLKSMLETDASIVLTDHQKPTGAVPSLTVEIGPVRGWSPLNLRELWESRGLLSFLAWRDIRLRYTQTVLGVAWAVLKPLSVVAVFSLVFGWFMQVPSRG